MDKLHEKLKTGKEGKNYQPKLLSKNLEKIYEILAHSFIVFLINGDSVGIKVFHQACMMMKSCSSFPYQIRCWCWEAIEFTPSTPPEQAAPPTAGKVATGVLYLLPGSDIKFPMGQWLGHTRMICGSVKHSVSGLCRFKSFPPRSGPRRFSQFHQRKTGNGEAGWRWSFQANQLIPSRQTC